MLGANFSALGAIFRNIKTGLFISCDGRGEKRSLLSIKVAKHYVQGNNANDCHYADEHHLCHGPTCDGNAYGYFYRKQAAPRPSEQARGARFAVILTADRFGGSH